jgi:hypothetical protein
MEYSDYLETRTLGSALSGVEKMGMSQGGAARQWTPQMLADFIGSPIGSSDVNVGGTITLGLDNPYQIFKFQSGVSTPKTIAFSGSSTFVFDIEIIISDIAAVLTWPSSVVMGDSRWIAGSKTWTAIEAGTYPGHAFTFDGTMWHVTISQLPSL